MRDRQDPWGSLASQPNIIGNPKIPVRDLIANHLSRRLLRNDTSWSLASTRIYTYTCASWHILVDPQIHTHIKEGGSKNIIIAWIKMSTRSKGRASQWPVFCNARYFWILLWALKEFSLFVWLDGFFVCLLLFVLDRALLCSSGDFRLKILLPLLLGCWDYRPGHLCWLLRPIFQEGH